MMELLDLMLILALMQFVLFAALVGRARGLYQVKAPATSGHEMFERYYRVQMNTLELLVVLVPAAFMAGKYFNPAWVSVAVAVYLCGRFVYWRAYVRDPSSRSLGFALSIIPVFALLIASSGGALFAML